MALVFTTAHSPDVLMARTEALHLRVVPMARRVSKGSLAPERYLLVGENFRREFGSLKQWDAILTNLERPGQKPVSSAGWGEEENEHAGMMVHPSKIRGYNWAREQREARAAKRAKKS